MLYLIKNKITEKWGIYIWKESQTTLHSFFFCDSGSGKCSVCRIAGSAPVDQSVIGGS